MRPCPNPKCDAALAPFPPFTCPKCGAAEFAPPPVRAAKPPRTHRYDLDSDRCACGGVVVFFEDGDDFDDIGEGCEAANLTWESAKADRDDDDERSYGPKRR